MRLNPETLARTSSRHPWRTVGIWLGVLALAGLSAKTWLGEVLTTEFDFTDKPESRQALQLVEDRLRGPMHFTEFIVVDGGDTTADQPEFGAYVAELTGEIRALGDEVVLNVGSYLEQTAPVSEDGTVALVTVTLVDTDLDEASADAAVLHDLVVEIEEPDGFTARLAGQASVNNEFEHLAEETLRRGESFGVMIALIVLLVVIGTVVAALLPIILAIAAITAAMGATALIGLSFELSFFVTNMITMIGLAVGIDYALFIVARYREERVRGHDVREAIGRSGATANRAVFFSGMTVVLALVGMLFVPNTIFRSLGIGAIVVVIFAVAASMTLLPAVISLLGDKVNRLRVRRRTALENVDKVGGMWDRITNAVMKRPVVWLLGGVAVMVLLSLSYFSIQTGFAGISTLPEDSESRQAFETLQQEFSGGLIEPVEVVLDGPITPEVAAAAQEFGDIILADPRFGFPDGSAGDFDPADAFVVNDARDLALITFPFAGDFQSEAAYQAIRDLRTDIVPAVFDGTGVDVYVGGFTAFQVDFFEDVDVFTPIVFVFVLGLSFVLLTIVFRSLVVPLKAILLNLLSVGAAYGMVVLFFQEGVGPEWVKSIADALGFIQGEAIEAWLPLFLFSVLFGLSMDYHVFLLSRIREHFDRTGDNRAAVAHGLRTTGAIITGAALIMVAVFGGFAAGELVPLQQMGFGLAVAVFLDATIVRSILVPASMRLLGNWNWYLPKWLQWLPAIDIEGHEAAEAAHQREETAALD
jgi:RND superfamily putative drug exporter